MALWDRIRQARERAGLSKSELARLCGVSPTAVAWWESADEARGTRPKPANLVVIARRTGEPLAELLLEYLQMDGDESLAVAEPSETGYADGDPETSQLLALWSELTPPVRAAILALIRAMLYPDGDQG